MNWGELTERTAGHAILTDYQGPLEQMPIDSRLVELAGEGGRCLDFGCGVGRNTRGLAEHFTEVVGYDLPNMVELARGMENPPNILYTEDWAEVLARHYDVAVASIVVQHLDPAEAKTRLLEISMVSPLLAVCSRTYMDQGQGDVLPILEDAWQVVDGTYVLIEDHFWCLMERR